MSPRPGDFDAEVDFKVYGIVPPNGWQLVDVHKTQPDSYAGRLGLIWLEIRWTPTGTGGGGERDARLDLRQAHAPTVGAPPSEGGAERVQLDDEVAGELLWIETGLGDPVGTVRWQLGSTRLELTAQGLDRDELLEVAKSAELVSPDRRRSDVGEPS